MANPVSARASSLLLQPEQAVAVAFTVNNVHLAVIVHVVTQDRKSCVTQIPVRMPFPFVMVGINIFKPAVGSQYVGLAIAIYIGNAGAVAVFRFTVSRHTMNDSVGIANIL